MSRPTLKLPHKTAPANPTGRSPTRKPIRGGSPAAKHSTSGRTDDKRAMPPSPTPRPLSAGDTTRRSGSESARSTRSSVEEDTGPDAAARSARGSEPLDRGDTAAESTAPRSGRDGAARNGPTSGNRPGKPAKIHPPRGIARSTGVRAALPTGQRASSDERAPIGIPAGLPPAPTDQAAPEPAPAAASTGPQRGLSKEAPRLAKRVSQLAQCSRREADEWIENGWVSVDGVVVNRLGARVNPKSSVEIRDAAKQHESESVTILYNKPLADATAGEAVDTVTAIRADTHWSEDKASFHFKATHLRGLAVAGRLEDEEHGMLVFTQEGSIARRLTGGDSRLEKEYHLRVDGELPPGGLELLRHGLSLDKVRLERAQVSWLSEQQLRFVVHENRKRQIQRQCELVGLRVTDIKRVRIGGVSLGKLPPGQWRYLRPDERF